MAARCRATAANPVPGRHDPPRPGADPVQRAAGPGGRAAAPPPVPLGRRAAAGPAALATSMAPGIVLCLAGFLELARNPLVAALGGWSGAGLRPWRLLPATWATLAGVAAAVLLVSALGFLAQVTCDLVRASRACGRLDG